MLSLPADGGRGSAAPRQTVAIPQLLGALGFFAVALFAASLLRLRRQQARARQRRAPRAADLGRESRCLRGFVEPPALAAMLPFLLLVGVIGNCGRPSPRRCSGWRCC